jgi:SlyX protein
MKGFIMEARLTELELRSMHQERSLQELFDTVFTQQQAIDRLERELVQVREQLNLALPSLVGQPEDDEPPPHY